MSHDIILSFLYALQGKADKTIISATEASNAHARKHSISAFSTTHIFEKQAILQQNLPLIKDLLLDICTSRILMLKCNFIFV